MTRALLHAGLATILWVILIVLWKSPGIDVLNQLELPFATWMNSFVGRSELFDRALIFLNTKPGEGACVLFSFVLYAWYTRRIEHLEWRAIAIFAVMIFAVWLACNRVSDVLENHVVRESPAVLLKSKHHDLNAIYGIDIKTSSHHCFPSNHGTVFFTLLFMGLFAFGRRVLWFAPLAILLSTPRVFGGAHWLTDDLVGSVLIAWPVCAVCSSILPGGAKGLAIKWGSRAPAVST